MTHCGAYTKSLEYYYAAIIDMYGLSFLQQLNGDLIKLPQIF